MKKICKGIIEGNIIRLKEKTGLPDGTYSIIISETTKDANEEEIKNRQLKLLDKGFHLGKKFYSKREELYDR